MTEDIKVKDNEKLVRRGKAIINKDTNGYKKRKQVILNQKQAKKNEIDVKRSLALGKENARKIDDIMSKLDSLIDLLDK